MTRLAKLPLTLSEYSEGTKYAPGVNSNNLSKDSVNGKSMHISFLILDASSLLTNCSQAGFKICKWNYAPVNNGQFSRFCLYEEEVAGVVINLVSVRSNTNKVQSSRSVRIFAQSIS